MRLPLLVAAIVVLLTTGCASTPTVAPRHQQADLYLPGQLERQRITYEVVDGVAMTDGDIVLGPVHELQSRYGRPSYGQIHGAVATARRSHLWPGGVMPYTLHASLRQSDIADLKKAVSHVNGSALTLRPRAPGDEDYVVFKATKRGRGMCTSAIGRIGGPQDIEMGDCGPGGVVHEILHAAGVYHEHQRVDRDQFVTIVWENIRPELRYAFEVRKASTNLSAYDYDSIMHYTRKSFSRNGQPTIVPHDQTAKIGWANEMSPNDRAGLEALYGGSAPPPPLPGIAGVLGGLGLPGISGSSPGKATTVTIPGLGSATLPPMGFDPSSVTVPPLPSSLPTSLPTLR